MNSLELDLGLLVLARGGDGSLGLTHVGEGTVFGLLVDVVHRLRVFLLVVDEGAAVRAGPAGNKFILKLPKFLQPGLTCTYHICRDVLRCDDACG